MPEGLRRSLTSANYGSLVLEFIVVVLGILIAFQIDRWAEDRRDRDQEQDYLVRLRGDLEIEARSMDVALQFAESRIANVLLLEAAVRDSSVALDQPSAVAAAVETATWRSFPQIDAFVYSELQSTGNLWLIRSNSLRRGLASHYSSHRHHERVGLDLTLQHHFDRLTSGILTTSGLRAIERGSWNDSAINVTAERALQITRELARRKDAVDLLPNIAQHHMFNQKVIELARSRTQQLIEVVGVLVEEEAP